MVSKMAAGRSDGVGKHALSEETHPVSVATASGCPTRSGPEPEAFSQHPPWNKTNVWLFTMYLGAVPLRGTLASYLFYLQGIHSLAYCIYTTKSVSIHMGKKKY